MLQDVQSPVTAQEADALFTSTSLVTLQGGVLATIAVSKGMQMLLSAWFPERVRLVDAIGKTLGILVALAIAFYAATQAASVPGTSWNGGIIILAFLNGFLIFSSAYGIQVGLTQPTGGAPGVVAEE